MIGLVLLIAPLALVVGLVAGWLLCVVLNEVARGLD